MGLSIVSELKACQSLWARPEALITSAACPSSLLKLLQSRFVAEHWCCACRLSRPPSCQWRAGAPTPRRAALLPLRQQRTPPSLRRCATSSCATSRPRPEQALRLMRPGASSGPAARGKPSSPPQGAPSPNVWTQSPMRHTCPESKQPNSLGDEPMQHKTAGKAASVACLFEHAGMSRIRVLLGRIVPGASAKLRS